MGGMLRYPSLLLVLGMALGLAACSRTDAGTPPLLGLTKPTNGVVARGRSLEVEGYALDPSGIQSIQANDTNLLDPTRVGFKLVRFQFNLNAPQSGEFTLKLRATNGNGQTRQIEVPITLDARLPTLRIERIEPMVETRTKTTPATTAGGPPTVQTTQVTTGYRVDGVILDDTGVDRVSVEYSGKYYSLSVAKGKEVPFFIEIAAKKATLIAVDAAGNRTSRTIP